MNSEVKREWIDALNSGKYPQGKHALQNTDGFCCLGVLCELAVSHGVIPPARLEEGRRDYLYGTAGDTQIAFLPWAVAQWAGISSKGRIHYNDPSVPPVDLASMNDNGMPFKGIAATIEEYA